MKEHTIISLAAISGIVILEICALLNGIDGIVLTATVASIAAIGGHSVGKQDKATIERGNYHAAGHNK
jgi:hypothetical protein